MTTKTDPVELILRSNMLAFMPDEHTVECTVVVVFGAAIAGDVVLVQMPDGDPRRFEVVKSSTGGDIYPVTVLDLRECDD